MILGTVVEIANTIVLVISNFPAKINVVKKFQHYIAFFVAFLAHHIINACEAFGLCE
jgi:hypothetical protein